MMRNTPFSPPHSNGEVARRVGGVIFFGPTNLTPPSAYDANTSPFEWGGAV